MTSAEERMQILQLLSDGKVSADEAAKLLKALEEGSRPKAPPPAEPRWLKVQVTDLASGKRKVNVTIPMGLVDAGVKVGARFAPEVEGMNLDELLNTLDQGAYGRIVDVTDEEGGERVEIFVE